jgi:hypothetical protein
MRLPVLKTHRNGIWVSKSFQNHKEKLKPEFDEIRRLLPL